MGTQVYEDKKRKLTVHRYFGGREKGVSFQIMIGDKFCNFTKKEILLLLFDLIKIVIMGEK